MATINVGQLDEEVVRKLKERAAAKNRSLEEETERGGAVVLLGELVGE